MSIISFSVYCVRAFSFLLLNYLLIVNSVYANPSAKQEMASYFLTGIVYQDTNLNKINDNEVGVSDLVMVLYNVMKQTCRSTKTDIKGIYRFDNVTAGTYQVYQAAREQVPKPINCNPQLAQGPMGYEATTAIISDRIVIVDQGRSQINFGHVSVSSVGGVNALTLLPDNQSVVVAGGVDNYWHRLTVPAVGSVNLSVKSNRSQDWGNVLYLDKDCDGILLAAEQEPITRSIQVKGNNTLCIVHKVIVPRDAFDNEKQVAMLIAVFSFGDGTTLLNLKRSVMNTTTVKAPEVTLRQDNTDQVNLRKYVKNITQNTAEMPAIKRAKIGDILQYRIEYRNTGAKEIANLVIHDEIPKYMVLIGEPSCFNTPSTLGLCMPTSTSNSLDWLFSGNLAPDASGSVLYQAKVK